MGSGAFYRGPDKGVVLQETPRGYQTAEVAGGHGHIRVRCDRGKRRFFQGLFRSGLRRISIPGTDGGGRQVHQAVQGLGPRGKGDCRAQMGLGGARFQAHPIGFGEGELPGLQHRPLSGRRHRRGPQGLRGGGPFFIRHPPQARRRAEAGALGKSARGRRAERRTPPGKRPVEVPGLSWVVPERPGGFYTNAILEMPRRRGGGASLDP